MTNRKERILRVKDYIETMPSLPTTVTKILEICNDPKTSPADLNRIISVDPVLMGKVLKLINSAYYGLPQQITSLVRAIIMLGLNTVKNLALSTAVMGSLNANKNSRAMDMDGFWSHSLCVGVTAKLIAKKMGVNPKRHEEFFIAGLLHDIGKIPLNNRYPEDYLYTIAQSDRRKIPLWQAEKEYMELDHMESGFIIASLWKLGDEIRDAIVHHHRAHLYEGPHKVIVQTVGVANFFAKYADMGFSGNRVPVRPPQEQFDALGVSLEDLEAMEELVKQEIKKASIFLELSL